MAVSLFLDITLGCAVSLAVAGWASFGYLYHRKRHTTQFKETSSTPPRSMRHLAEQQKDETSKLAETIPAKTLILGPLGQVLGCNSLTEAHYKNSLPALLRHPATRDTLAAALKAPIDPENGLPAICATTVNLDVPVKRTIRLAMRRLTHKHGRDSRVLVLLSDRSTMQAADRMRADFVAHASHELRTPLASLNGFIDLLKEHQGAATPESQMLYLDIMTQQATRMQRLIDRLLYLSQLQLRGHTRPRTPLEIDELFAVISGEVTPRFKDNNRVLHIQQEEGLTLLADEDELVQVFLNLIENAIRYATQPDKTLHIHLKAYRAGPDENPSATSDGILLSLEDNGPGIAAHHLPRLTERFYRVPENQAATAEAQQGTGLGLAIVRQILERHGGKLRFTSVEGQGTTCWIWLPTAAL